jgi:hypothetical protein
VRQTFTNLKGQLSKLRLWGKDTPKIVSTYCGIISELGVEVAIDTLDDLLKLPEPEIKDRVTARIFGDQPVGEEESTQGETSTLPLGLTPSPGETKVQNEETKTTEEKGNNHASDPNTAPSFGEDLDDRKELSLEEGNTDPDNPIVDNYGAPESMALDKEQEALPESLAALPLEGSKKALNPHPPDPGSENRAVIMNLSSSANNRSTLLDFFPAIPPQ